MGFFSSSSTNAWADDVSKAVPPAPQPVDNAVQPESSGTDYSSANKEIAKKLWEKNNGKPLSRYQAGTDIITADIGSKLEKTKVDWAREAYKAQYGDGTDDQVNKWMKENQRSIDAQMYGALTKQAVDLGVDFDKSSDTYQSYLAGLLTDGTPKDTRSFWEKTKSVGKQIGQGIVDTPIGLGAALTDEAFGTNYYKSYFGDRTSIKEDNTSFLDKGTNLLGEQMAWLDVAFGIGTFLTAGTGAPVFASLSASIKGGGKAIAKNILKSGSSDILEAGLRDAFKGSSDELIAGLIKGDKGITASISDLAAKEGMDTTAYMSRLRSTLTSAGKDAFKGSPKEYKSYMKNVNDFTSLDAIGEAGSIAKQNRWVESLSDGLGLPTQFIRLGKEGNLLERMTTKSAGVSFMGLGMNVAIPSTQLLPGVGDWFETTGLRLGGALASEYVKYTRGGIIERERQKFIDDYGIDPENTTNPTLQKTWTDSLEYKMRYALPSEILTGNKFSERSNAGQLVWGAFDAAANFAGVMAGIHGIGKGYGFTAEQLSPVHMENGEVVSNIGFIKELNDIYSSGVDEATKTMQVEDLKLRVSQGDPTLLTTIKSAKELKSSVAEIIGYYQTLKNDTGGKSDVLMRPWMEGMKSVVEKMDNNDLEGALLSLGNVNKTYNETASQLVSPAALKRVNDKVDILSTYFEKVRKNHGFLSNLTKQFVVNTMTNAIRDPSGAIIQGTEELTAAAKSVFREIDDMNDILVDTFTAKGNYIANRYKEAFDEKNPLDARIESMIETTGLTPTREMVVAMRVPMVTALTKTQFEIKKYQNETLDKIFDSVFSEYGTKIKISGEKSLGEIMREIAAGDIGSIVKLSDDLELMMNDDIVARKSQVDKHKQFLQGNALQIASMDKLFTDLTTQLHAEKSRQRIGEVEFVKTEESTVAEQMTMLDARIKALETRGIDPVVEKNLLSEMQKQDPEATIIKDVESEVDPLASPTAHLAIASESVQAKIVDQANEGSKELLAIEKESTERKVALQTFSDSIFRAHEYILEGEKKNAERDSFTEAIEDKEVDNYFKNEARIKAYDDMIFRGIADEYNKQATIFFDKEGQLNLESLKKFTEKKNQLLNKQQEKLYNEIALELTKDEPNKMKLAFKARRIEELVNMQTTKDFSRKTIVELAKNSESVDIFRDRLERSIKDTFKFTDEAISKFMHNQFGDDDSKIIPFYQLYRKQTTVPAFKVAFDMKDGELESVSTIYSREDPLSFSDEYGNTTLNRLEGLGTANLRNNFEVLSLDDITINGAPLDSYWVAGIKGEKIDDKKAYYSEKIMPAIMKEMEDNGYVFLGDFQEEGKKRIFVKAKDGETSWEGAMEALTGVNFKNIDGIEDPVTKNQVISNLQKYAKLIWWGEINPDKETWQAAIMPAVTREVTTNRFKDLQGVDELITALEAPRTDGVRHLIYEDNVANPYDPSDKPEKEKVSDGRTYNLRHYAATLNISIGANKRNNIFKTATIAGPGQFIKSQDITAGDDVIADINVINALYRSEDPKIKSLLNFATINFGDTWYHNPEAISQVHNIMKDYRVIDRIVPLSAYKNIFTRKVDPANLNFEFENYRDGQILEVPLDSIGVKAIDAYKSPRDRKNETVKFSNQVIRNIHEIKGFSREEANSINDVFNSIRKEDYDELLNLASQVGDNPNLIISKIEDKFGLKFNDFQKSSFITEASSGNLERFFTNIMKAGVTTGTSLKGNQIDLTAIPNYWEARERINHMLEPEMKDNWIVLSKEFYSHLTGDRYMLFRYPVVSEKVINAPKIIWAEDLAQDMGIPIEVGSSVMASHTIIKKMEGDFDGDKVVLVTDPRLESIQPLINKFADQPKFDFEVDNSTANIHDPDSSVRDLWYETAYDTFEGKANIGILDNKITEIERLMQMGVINDNNPVRNGENPYGKLMPDGSREAFNGKRTDYLRQILGVTLQRAVDNKAINIQTINRIISESIGVTARDLAKVNADINLKYKDANGDMQNKAIILPDGKPVELWKIRLLGSSAGSVNFLRSIAHKAKNGEYKLSDAEYLAYKKVSADEFQKNIRAVQQIIKKKDFFNDEKIQLMVDAGKDEFEIRKAQAKDITKISKDYIEVKKAYDELVSFYGKNVIDRDPQMRFIGNMEGSFLREFPDMRKSLQPTLAIALEKVKEKFPITLDSSVAKDFRTLFAEYEKASRGYSKAKDSGIYPTKEEYETARAKLVGDIEDKIYALADTHKIDDLDPVIIANLKSTSSNLKDMMTAKGKENLDALIHTELNWTPLEKLKIYDSTIDISPLYENMGKVPTDDYVRIMNEVFGGEEFSKYFESPRYQLLKSNKITKAQRDMTAGGVHPEQFKEFLEPIKNAEPEEGARIIQKVINITPEDAKIVLELMKETGDVNGSMELLMALGYKEIAGEKLGEVTRDAYTTVVNSPFTKPNC